MKTTAEKKYTPGPWRWHGYYLLQDVPTSDGSEGKETNPFSTPCGYPIADDGSAGGEYSGSVDIDSPDARLIAAAPEMLEALKAAIPILEYVDKRGGCEELISQVRAAITKAETTL